MAQIGNWRRLIVFVLLTGLWHDIASAEPQSIRTATDLDRFVSQYYLHPQPDAISSLIEFLGTSRALQNKGSSPFFVAFFANVIALNPDRAVEWASVIDRQDPITRDILSRAVAASSVSLRQICMN